MKVDDFFDNLAVFFKNEDDTSIEGLVSIYRDEDGIITEIRIFNPEYEEFMIITRDKQFEIINVPEFRNSIMESDNKVEIEKPKKTQNKKGKKS